MGSGISGLTIALLQARQGKRVTLIERQPKIGGYLNRFMRDGLHFDTGFHFTGGNGGIFQQILEKLEFDVGDFKSSPLPTDVWLEETQRRFDFPNRGLQAQCQAVCDAFPEKAASIRQYYEAELNSIIDSPLHDLSLLKRMDALSGMTEFDAITVNDLFLKLGIDEPQLRALLPIMAVCHGTPPCEASMAHHSRCSYSLDSSISTVENGGDAFLAAFRRGFSQLDVTMRSATTISQLRCSENAPVCQEAVLSDGTSLPVERIFFAVHPSAFLPLFPERLLGRSIMRRSLALKSTGGCFAMHGFFDDDFRPPSRFSICLRRNELDSALLPGQRNRSISIVTANEADNGRATFTVFSNMFPDDCPPYHGDEYDDFKERTGAELLDTIFGIYPEYRGRMHVTDVSTPWTARRYSPPDGSAYGTRQIMSQSRISGRLPLENCFCLGHHAQFPGILGCMLGALILNELISKPEF